MSAKSQKFTSFIKTTLGGCLALFTVLTLHAESDPNGLWKWTTLGRNGGAPRVFNLRLKADGETLTGALITPNRTNDTFNEIQITDGKISGDSLSFDVARPGFNGGNPVVTKYAGSISGDLISGTVETPRRNGAAISLDWKAERNTTGQLVAGPKIVIKPGYDENGFRIVNDTHYKEISVDDAQKYLDDHPDAIILDLRTPEEYADGHLPNAKNYNVTDLATYQDVLAPLDKTKWYVVHSAVGHYRTVRALEYFEAHGFEHAVAIDGGYAAWAKAGKPTEK
jgi:rhodanese-related sulfurtransferase